MQFSREWGEDDGELPYILEEILPPPILKMSRIDWAGTGFEQRNEESTT